MKLLNKLFKDCGFMKNYKLVDKHSGEMLYLCPQDFLISIEILPNELIKMVWSPQFRVGTFTTTFGKNTNKIVYQRLVNLMK